MLRELNSYFPVLKDDFEPLSKQYNAIMLYSWDRVFEFVKMHYCISDRSDSGFWLENRDPATIPEVLSQRLRAWRNGHPKAFDFFSKFEIFDVENFLYVLYGMYYPTRPGFMADEDLHRISHVASEVRKVTDSMKGSLPGHRELLDKIRAFGMQKH